MSICLKQGHEFDALVNNIAVKYRVIGYIKLNNGQLKEVLEIIGSNAADSNTLNTNENKALVKFDNFQCAF